MQGVIVEGLWQAYRWKTSRGHRRRGAVHWALENVTMSARPGEVVGLVGRNGSGKTTLLRSIAGVLEPSRGVVRTPARVVSLVDLTAGIDRDLSGRENVLLTSVLLGLGRGEARARYDEIVEFAELAPETLRMPLYTYSSGMVLRLAFSLLLACRPEALCVDEVLAVGDELFQRKCLAAIEALSAQGASVVIASHDLALLADRCATVHVLDRGRLEFAGRPEEALPRYEALLRTGRSEHGRSQLT